jgi:F0F1-type ATP synthase membrane subunit c/vacuolar-type H+-ATPase subunit K
VVDGEQKGPLPPIELSQLFAKGAVGLDSYVWKEGFDDWKVASDVPELVQIFGGPGAPAKEKASGGDDTSAFGTGGDLFNEGGREPTSEIDTNSSMFAGFDEAPTPTDTESSPLAASASNDSGAALGATGGGMGGGSLAGAAPQKMTGQRNENSVLFSLSNLQQLASRGGSPAEPSAPAASQPQASAGGLAGSQAAGEGSGLIDIRALAKSTTPGTKAAPSQAVDDLLAIGAGAGGTLGAPLLGPTPLETSDGNRWLWIGGALAAAIAIVGAGVGVGMALGGSEDEALEIAAPTPQQQPSQPTQGSNEIAAAVPAPAEPEQEAAVIDIEPEAPVEAATLEETERPQARPQSTARRRSSSSSAQRRQRTTSVPTQAAPPKRKSNNLDALMDEVVGGSSPSSKPKHTSKSSSSSSSNLPDAPSRNDVKTALQGVSGGVKACRKDAGGTATVNVTFSGKTGRATGAKVASGPFKGTPVGACIESAVKRARVPRFKQSSFKVTFPYRL